MSAKKDNQIKILDCTIRDGGYLNNWNFENKVAEEVYRTASDAGVDVVEIGFRSSKKYFNKNDYGPWRFCDEEELRKTLEGVNGAEIGLMIDYGKTDIDDVLERDKSIANMIRVAVHKNKIIHALKLIEKIKDKGYTTSIQMMGYSTFTQEEQKKVVGYLRDSNVDFAYVADSYGSIFPFQIKELFKPLLEIPNLKIGFHPHNSLQMAFANTIEAMNQGVDIIDGSMYGMGRGAGNLPLEIIISYLQQKHPDKYNVIPILQCIDKYFINFKKNTGWGYQLPYMISGIFNSHPYYAKTLIDWREYTIDDVWHVLENIERKKPVGFSEELLKDVLKSTLYIDSGEKPDYIDRYKGQDFLVLANGPSLKKYKSKIDQFIKKYNPIILGANYLGNLFVPDYHCFTNKRRFIDYVSDVSEESKILVGSEFKDEFIKMYTKRDCEKIFHFKDNGSFKIKDSYIYTGYFTVSLLLIPLANIMGAKRIFIAGMDGYKNIDKKPVHFYNEKDEAEKIEIEMEKQRKSEGLLDEIRSYLAKNNFERFYIITPTSYDKHYKNIDSYL